MTFGEDYGFKEVLRASYSQRRLLRVSYSQRPLRVSYSQRVVLRVWCSLAVCRGRGRDVVTTVVDFVFVLFLFLFLLVCGVPPLTSHGYLCDCLVCCWGRRSWRHHPASGDRDGGNNNNHGDNKWDVSQCALHPTVPSLSEGGWGQGQWGRGWWWLSWKGGGEDTVIAAAINCHRHRQQCHHWCHQLNPTTTSINNDCYCCCWQPPLPLPHSQWWQLPEASGWCLSLTAAMAVIINESGGQWRPQQCLSSLTVVFIDKGGGGMEGWWHNGIDGNGVFGQWWWRRWRSSSSTVQRRLMPPQPSCHCPWWQRCNCHCHHQPLLPLAMTAITAIDNRHRHCHTVDSQQCRRSSSTATATARADVDEGG